MNLNFMRESIEVSYDFIGMVPKERKANLEYRVMLYERCAKDAKYREAIKSACRRDTKFFFNAFLWVYEPRPGLPCGYGKIPFITWPAQDRGIEVLDRFWGLSDIRFWKTRGEGATWVVCMRIMKDWCLDNKWNASAFGLVTRNEETVDSSDDPDSLMWKLDWELEQLPSWLAPRGKDFSRKVTDHSLKNNLNYSTVIGYSASEDVGSGGRKKVFMMDELAKFGAFRKGADYAAMTSTLSTTNCRVIISTPKGVANAYHDSITEDTDIDRYNVRTRVLTEEDHKELNDKGLIIMHWTDNPTRNCELFKVSEGGSIEAIDVEKYGPISKEYQERWDDIRTALERRGYRVVGTVRSPWYDRQCLRTNATPQSIAQELDLDFGGSGYTLFDARILDIAAKSSCPARHEMEISYDNFDLENIAIKRQRGGRLKLWITFVPGTDRPPPGGRYSVGCDIASGLGGSTHSNSVASVIDLDTGEQVAEWASNAARPDDFCDISICIATIFNKAIVIHEANGPFGKAFTAQLLRRRYPNVFLRRELFKFSTKQTKQIGWGSNQETKPEMLLDLGRKISNSLIVVRSKQAASELRSWVMKNGRVVHAKASTTDDESSKNEAHGDRVIAIGVAALLYDDSIMSERDSGSEAGPISGTPPVNSMASRLAESDDEVNRSKYYDW